MNRDPKSRTTRPSRTGAGEVSRKSRGGKDRLTQAQRSWNMSRIRSKDTKPEKIVRSLLHRMGYRFRLHMKIPIPFEGTNSVCPQQRGKSRTRVTRPSGPIRHVRPDIVLRKHKTAIFVHGCFWHRHRHCRNCTTPTHRREWWLAKFSGNTVRDRRNQSALRKLGWRVIVIWECELRKPDRLERKLPTLFQRKKRTCG